MKILKYKKLSTSKYKVLLDDGSNITLHENIIIKYNLLITKNISKSEMQDIIKDNNNYLVYDLALKYISTKMRCESELREYLKKKNIENNEIEMIIVKLKENGFINERLYVKSFISDKVRLSNYGPNKVRNELLNLNIDKGIIEEELCNYPKEEILSNLEKLIDKKIKSNKNYGETILKQKIISEFLIKGYDKEDIIEILNSKNLIDDNLYEKEYKKLYDRYSKKYSDEQLEYIIKQKLYQKGFKKMQ